MPVLGVEMERPGTWALAAQRNRERIVKIYRSTVDVDVVSDSGATVFMDEEDIAGVIGKGGKTIDIIEKKLGTPP